MLSVEAASLIAQVLPVVLLVITIQNRNRSDDELRTMPLWLHAAYLLFMWGAALGGTVAILFCLIAVTRDEPLPVWQSVLVGCVTVPVVGAFMIEMMGATHAQVNRALRLRKESQGARPTGTRKSTRGRRARRADQ